MKKNDNKEILVYADWEWLNKPQLIGRLYSSHLRGKEIFSFEYSKEWLQSPFAVEIDPDLKLYGGLQYLHNEKNNFGAFSDSSPDRWGRVLMDRREAVLARIENRVACNLNELDYLLDVFDEQRTGALRFKISENGAFLNNDNALIVPPFTSIRELEQASYQIEKNLINDDARLLKWFSVLFAPGSSLGGARPKAGVRNIDGSLWIAKFPSKNDKYDTGAWEMVAHDLAEFAGINVPQAMAHSFYTERHSFLTKRFDRTNNGKRLHFASAMTLLGYSDGEEGASYLDLAELITQKCANVNRDLEELFKRIVFSICISNTDDHLRNHGFLLAKNGWQLSPAYDMNPNPTGKGLKLNISEQDNSLNLDVVKEVAPYFRLSNEKADIIIQKTINAASKWEQTTAKYNISREERDRMSMAFESRNF